MNEKNIIAREQVTIRGPLLIIFMGICYSQQQQWEAYKQNRKGRHRRPRNNNKTASVIYEEKSIYQSSFASNPYSSFRDDLHNTISSLAAEGGDVFMGSLVEMKEEELEILYKSLHKINSDGERHHLNQPIILCNLKTKNYLHTHKVKHPDCRLLNEVSCCPYTSNHIPEYDIWKMIQVEEEPQQTEEGVLRNQENPENGDQTISVYIYHPFTQRFLAFERGAVVGSENKQAWKVQSFGPRRNGGFLRVSCSAGELCMSEQKGLLQKHRKLQVCRENHISHIWELSFVDPDFE